MRMNKVTLGLTIADIVVFEGVSVIVKNAVKKVIPKGAKKGTKILAKIGGYAISAATTSIFMKEVEEAVDEVVKFKEAVEEAKKEFKEELEKAKQEEESRCGESNVVRFPEKVVPTIKDNVETEISKEELDE